MQTGLLTKLPSQSRKPVLAYHIRNMDISTKTRCFRQSKRYDLFNGQWEQKRFESHRKKVENAGPRIDVQTPKSAAFQHVKVKAKKLQKEEERKHEVMSHNLILLQHLTEIASSKRINDGRVKKVREKMAFKEKWPSLYEQILLFRRLQLQQMIGNATEETSNQDETTTELKDSNADQLQLRVKSHQH